MTYFSYVNRQGNLIVRTSRGPHDIQQLKVLMRRFIGEFDAPNIQEARRIAQELHNGQ